MNLGAFEPGDLPVQIEHIFWQSDAPQWPLDELKRIRAAGRTPLLTIEPWTGIGKTLDWLPHLGPCLLRYGHEFNGWWYPWSRDPAQFVADWRAITLHRNQQRLPVQLVWCPNVFLGVDGKPLTAFGARPPLAYWPGALDPPDLLGVDGYNMAGEPPNPRADFATIFGPTLAQLHGFAPNKPIVICETASARGFSQAAWIRDMWDALRRNPYVTGVCWFNRDKEQPWGLSKAGARVFLAGGGA